MNQGIYYKGKKYPKPEWAEYQLIRMSGLVEDICIHGIGHPNREWIKDYPANKHLAIHGCDGCCNKGE